MWAKHLARMASCVELRLEARTSGQSNDFWGWCFVFPYLVKGTIRAVPFCQGCHLVCRCFVLIVSVVFCSGIGNDFVILRELQGEQMVLFTVSLR